MADQREVDFKKIQECFEYLEKNTQTVVDYWKERPATRKPVSNLITAFMDTYDDHEPEEAEHFFQLINARVRGYFTKLERIDKREKGKKIMGMFNIDTYKQFNTITTPNRLQVNFTKDSLVDSISGGLFRNAEECEFTKNIINYFLSVNPKHRGIDETYNEFRPAPDGKSLMIRYQCSALEKHPEEDYSMRCTNIFEFPAVGCLVRYNVIKRNRNAAKRRGYDTHRTELNVRVLPYPHVAESMLYSFNRTEKHALLQYVNEGDNEVDGYGDFKYPERLVVLPRHNAPGVFLCHNHDTSKIDYVDELSCRPLFYYTCKENHCLNKRAEDSDKSLKYCSECEQRGD